MAKHSEDGTLPVTSPTAVTATPPLPAKSIRHEYPVFIGEFIGTFMFLFLAFTGTQIAIVSATIESEGPGNPDMNPVQQVSKLIYISFAFGAALAVNVSIFADISGGMFNPAVTLSLLLIGAIKWLRAIQVILAQLIAGICAAFVVSALLPGPLPTATKLEPTISVTRGLFLEMFLTAQLVLTILVLPGGPSKPLVIGLTLFVAELCGVYYTGGSLNPARSFGPAVVTGFDGYHWIYWVGPALGAGLGSVVFLGLRVLEPKHESV
ncbi:Aquaporin-1 [Kalmusia sp. IMI 367209]|nr:Aquaporin-1 [Kalmusia sp. IMI 367209]